MSHIYGIYDITSKDFLFVDLCHDSVDGSFCACIQVQDVNVHCIRKLINK